MGTPGFAVPALDILVRNGYDVAAVITAPDKPAGRGQQVSQSAIKQYAVEHGLNILQPAKLKDPQFLDDLRALNANLFIVVAFRMLPEVVWQMPEYGTFNLHASLLPQYRGAAPINRAIINGETETGVTTFFLQHEIDTGNIIFQEKIAIADEDNAGTVHDNLASAGADLVLKTVKAIENETAQSTPQLTTYPLPLTTLHHAPKLFKEDGLINWSKPVREVHNLVRGLSPYPGAYTQLEGKTLKIYRSRVYTQDDPVPVAEDFQTDHKTYLRFRCGDGWLDVLELQLEGKKRMGVEEFLRGHRFS